MTGIKRHAFGLALAAVALLWLLAAGAARAQVTTEPYPVGVWYAQYWNNREFLGSPLIARTEPEIDYYWGTDSPVPGVIFNDYWAARWTRTVQSPGGTYRVIARMDDAMRIFVDGQPVIDSWYDSAEHTKTVDITLTPGAHLVRVDYYDAQGVAMAVVDYEPIGTGGGSFFPNWRAEYFNNVDLGGLPVLVRDEAQLALDWGVGSPAPGLVAADNFSARLTHTWQGAPGVYRLTLTSDDGARLFIDNVLAIDSWAVQGVTSRSVEQYFSGAPVALRVDYFEKGGGAMVRLEHLYLSGGGGTGGGGGTICPAPNGNTAVVIAGGPVNLRVGPGLQSPTLGQLEPCEQVTFLGYNAGYPGWVYVEDVYRQAGWVATEFLTFAPGAEIN
ncbi:exported protein of unknown function [Candidatus Promineifilum breve]|uniref:PA14 domain-containing protein n=1 Tax=Candidatus Promineifilum breve TaxID=1806508 RepID=A0A160T9U3_9CHLR|nr:PA14 domain-containing protein [Candidatus Promineifilum breve]CUS06278.1 exported protein of unknown function [Candidatus Promineifilum breve]